MGDVLNTDITINAGSAAAGKRCCTVDCWRCFTAACCLLLFPCRCRCCCPCPCSCPRRQGPCCLLALHHFSELTQTVDHRAESCKVLKLVHNEGQVIQHVVECTLALVDHAKLNLAREEERRHHCCRQQLDHVAVEGGEEVEVAAGGQQAQVVLHCSLEALHQQPPLILLAPVKRNALGVLTYTHEVVAQVRLPRLLVEVEAHQVLAQDDRPHSAPC
mmetsp:Transcript_3378/g.7394  ORF Transcript_3378/g.7394 Transcript_3378/m.7394 type:complete len:217 (+) Transcript_3378:47-697(+)